MAGLTTTISCDLPYSTEDAQNALTTLPLKLRDSKCRSLDETELHDCKLLITRLSSYINVQCDTSFKSRQDLATVEIQLKTLILKYPELEIKFNDLKIKRDKTYDLRSVIRH